MQTYRLVITRHDKLLGHFESSTPWSLEAVRDIAGHLLAEEGYQLELQVAYDERRILDTGAGVVRIMSCEPLFKPAAPDIFLT